MNTDLAPTIADLLGAQYPAARVDGRPLTPLLGSAPPPESAWRQHVLIEHWEQQDDFSLLADFQALRSDQFSYIAWYTEEKEFYNVEVDPFQVINRIDSFGGRRIEQMDLRMRELMTCRGDSCRELEDAPLSLRPLQP